MATKAKEDKETLKAKQKAAAAAEIEVEKQRHAKRKAAMYEDTTGAAVKNILNEFLPFAKFDRNGVELELFFTSPELPSFTTDLSTWIFNLTKENMQKLYDGTPGFEWKDSKKRAEMVDTDTRYLIARRKADQQPVAFVSFRFMLEGPFDVLYIWELQLTKEVQRKGLGKHMMTVCELAARKTGMQLVMLTVLDNNTSAVHFYREKMRYITDMTSPSMDGTTDAGYEILSKCVNAAAYADITKRFT